MNPLDHMLAGAVMGAVYRFNMGPKGMVGGGVLGSMLGLQGGLLFWLLQYATGESVEERWRREYSHTQELTTSIFACTFVFYNLFIIQ